VKYKTEKVKFVKSAFLTLFCMVSMVSILLTMQKKYTSENDPLQAQITMREFQFFESIIEKIILNLRAVLENQMSFGQAAATYQVPKTTLYRVSQKKKTSPELPYLSDDFNYLYTKLNGC
jgi:hypothetical protein